MVGIPKTWSEELVAEWLQLEGYLVMTGVKAGSGKGGGKREADVVGVRQKGGSIEIKHVEVGMLIGSFKGNIDKVKEKFEKERLEEVKKRVSSRFGVGTNEVKSYQKVYVMVPWDESWKKGGEKHTRYKEELEKSGIEFLYLGEVVQKVNELAKGVAEGEVEDSLWLTKMVRLLDKMGLLSLDRA